MEKLLVYILTLLHWSGFNPLKTDFFSILRMLWTISTYVMIMIWLFMEGFLNFNGFATASRAIELFPVLILCSGKLSYMIIYRKNIENMILQTKFTLQNIYPKKITQIGRANTDLVLKMFKFYALTTVFTLVQFNLAAYLTRIPFILTYKENEMSDDYWKIVFFIDLNFTFFVSLAYNGYNWLFIFFTTHVVSEMKMLKAFIIETDIDIESDRFRVLVKYHNHILSLVKDMSNNYSSIMLGELVFTFLALCFALFCCTMDGLPPDMEHLRRYGNTAFNFGLLLALFCYAGDVLTEQCEGVSSIIFYKLMQKSLDKNIKFTSFMMIGRSQMNIAISIGGFWDLNMETYYLVMRKCMSFLTFMQALREKGTHHPHGQNRRSLAF